MHSNAQQAPQTVLVRKSKMQPLVGRWVEVEDAQGLLLPQRVRCYTSRHLFPDGTYVDTVFCPNPRRGESLPDVVHSWLSGYWTVVGDTLVLRHNTYGIDGMDELDRFLLRFDNEFVLRTRKLLARQRAGNCYWARPQLLSSEPSEH